MKLGLEYFHWSVSGGGYEWRDAEADDPDAGRRFLVLRQVDAAHRRTHPLVDDPTLFKTFAALKPTEAGFTSFANAYGLLGVGTTLQISGPIERATGEAFTRWRDEWSRLRAAVYVLDAVHARDGDTLEKCVTFDAHGARVRLDHAPPGSWRRTGVAAPIANAEDIRPWLWEFAHRAPTRTERLARLAGGWLQDVINASIDATRLEDGAAAVPARVLFNAEADRWSLHVVPASLLAALWLQCARVLTDNPTFRQCAHCQRWFEVSQDGRRQLAKYCHGNACKMAAYRQRKAEKDRTAPRARSAPARKDLFISTPDGLVRV
jgi:hypothetical protein